MNPCFFRYAACLFFSYMPILAQNYDLAASRKELEQRLASCEFNGGLFVYDTDSDSNQYGVFPKS